MSILNRFKRKKLCNPIEPLTAETIERIADEIAKQGGKYTWTIERTVTESGRTTVTTLTIKPDKPVIKAIGHMDSPFYKSYKDKYGNVSV